MKKLYTTLTLALLVISTFAQTANISITTALSINSQITIGLSGNTSSTPIQIDWGNGVKENFTIGDTEEFFGYPVKGSNIKIWGAGITGLNIQSKSITALDFFEATNLKWLFCKNNQITTLNLTGCSTLTFVECNQNLISSIMLPTTTTLTYVDCSDNNLNLSSLPLKQGSWATYIYSPQKDYALAKTVYAVNEEIDLSNQLTINGNTTTYTWKTVSGATLINGTDYNVTGGKFTFLKTYSESIYCEMTNTTFPSLTLKTISISILPLPAVVMTTTNAIGSTFSFTIAATANSTPIQVDWGNGILTNFTIGNGYSDVSNPLTGNTIKIYGVGISKLELQSKNLTSIDISGATALTKFICTYSQLTTLDVSKNTALTDLFCSGNKLATLDVSKNTELTSLWCNSNQLTTLDVSNNTALTDLVCGTNQLATLDVSKNTALTYLSCGSNQLTTLDVSKNTALTELYCSWNKLTTLDLSKNTALTELLCAVNQLTTLDVSNNTALTYLNCSLNKLITLDVTKNIALTELNCNTNQLTLLDVSKNTMLTILSCYSNQLNLLDLALNTVLKELYCNSNRLTILDVTKNKLLTKLNCGSNQLTFATLPIKQADWTNFIYSPQAVIKLLKNKYSVNEEIDLSKEFTHGETNTVYIWKTEGGVTLDKDIDYYEVNGKFTFIKAQSYKVYCQMTNASLPLLTQTTENITILPSTPTLTFSTNNSVGSTFSFSISSGFNNSIIHLDWGDGTLNDYTISSSGTYISGLLTGNSIKIFGIDISSINISSKNITVLDVSEASLLKTLNCGSNKLTVLDLSKNTSLTIINCESNNLTFATLPLKQQNWTTYTYIPQSKIILDKKRYNIFETVDLGNQFTANGNTTNYIWRTKEGITLTSGTDYNVAGGITTFLKVPNDSVYCRMTNATFPALTLSTTNIKVSDPTSIDSEFAQTTKVYPNPVSSLLWVASEEAIKRVEIYNVVGTKVFEQDYNNAQKANINTAGFPKGLLIIKVYGANSVMEKKVLKE